MTTQFFGQKQHCSSKADLKHDYIYFCFQIDSDVMGLKFPGFGKGGTDPYGFWVGSCFLTLGVS